MSLPEAHWGRLRGLPEAGRQLVRGSGRKSVENEEFNQSSGSVAGGDGLKPEEVQ